MLAKALRVRYGIEKGGRKKTYCDIVPSFSSIVPSLWCFVTLMLALRLGSPVISTVWLGGPEQHHQY